MSEFEKELTNKVSPHDRTHNDNELFIGGILAEHFKDWQPPKPLVVVPQIVADYIETQKDNDYDGNAFLILKHYESFKQDGNDSELDMWIAINFNDFLEAIVNGYTVEKEKKFSLVNKITGEYLVLPAIEYRIKNENIFDHSAHCKNDYLSEWKPEMYQFTEVEIASMETGSYEQIPVEMSDNGI